MAKVLVKYHGNWADEMDLNGFIIIDKEVWENHLKRVEKFLKDYKKPYEVYCGTNEQVQFTSFSEYKNSFNVHHLSDREAKHLTDLFGTQYGHFMAIRREGMYEHPDPSDDDENLEF